MKETHRDAAAVVALKKRGLLLDARLVGATIGVDDDRAAPEVTVRFKSCRDVRFELGFVEMTEMEWGWTMPTISRWYQDTSWCTKGRASTSRSIPAEKARRTKRMEAFFAPNGFSFRSMIIETPPTH